jgi:hypothetical protein
MLPRLLIPIHCKPQAGDQRLAMIIIKGYSEVLLEQICALIRTCIYREMATGQVDGRRGEATANFHNDASLQQLFVDVRDYFGSTLMGA